MDLFKRLEKGRPMPPTKVVNQEEQKIERAQKLLDWLASWNKPTICARDILTYGPRPTRKREKVAEAAKILVKNGWLIPIQTHRYDMEAWRIVRKPMLYPDCTAAAQHE